jgi:hypothetical protein
LKRELCPRIAATPFSSPPASHAVAQSRCVCGLLQQSRFVRLSISPHGIVTFCPSEAVIAAVDAPWQTCPIRCSAGCTTFSGQSVTALLTFLAPLADWDRTTSMRVEHTRMSSKRFPSTLRSPREPKSTVSNSYNAARHVFR